MKTYKDLVVWQKAMDLVVNVYQVVSSFPKSEQYCLTCQLCRAVVSIPSNIAEGYGRGTRKDYVRFLHQARGSAYEVGTQLHIAQRLGYLVNTTEFDSVSEVCRILGAMIMKLIPTNPETSPTS